MHQFGFLLRGFLVLVIVGALGAYVVASLHDEWQPTGDPELRRQAQALLQQQLADSPYNLSEFRLSERTREDSYHVLGELRWKDKPGRQASFVAVLDHHCAASRGGDTTAACWSLRRFEVVQGMDRVARVPIITKSRQDAVTAEARAKVDDGLPNERLLADGLGPPRPSDPIPVMGSWQGLQSEAASESVSPDKGHIIAGNQSAGARGAGADQLSFAPPLAPSGDVLERQPLVEAPDKQGSQGLARSREPAPDWRVAVARVNVRAGPGLSHQVITTLGQGATLSLQERRKTWGRFSWQDAGTSRQGWIFLELLKPAGPGPHTSTGNRPAD